MSEGQRRKRGFALIPILLLIAIVGILWWQRHRIISPIGTFLDNGESPQQAETVLVLAGGWQGERVLRAGQLVREGYAPYVLLSGPSFYYARPECDYAIPFAAERGYPKEWFQCAPNRAHSTREEAVALIEELKRRGIRKCIIVSVRTHIRRARMLFKEVTPPGMEFHFVSAEDPEYSLENWYKSRQGKKAVLLEWMKLVTTPFES